MSSAPTTASVTASARPRPGRGGQPESSRLERMVAIANPLMSRLTTVDAPVCVLATLDGYGIRYLAVSALDPGDVRVPRVDDRSMLH